MKPNKLATPFAALAILAMLLGSVPNALSEEVTLFKNPQCGCCESYAGYLRENGFSVTVNPTHQLAAMSRDAGLPEGFQGCHLAFVDDYFVSGHVPVNTINKLLAERPDVKGITLPNMPMGSPGMTGEKTEPFTIYSIDDGEPEIFSVE